MKTSEGYEELYYRIATCQVKVIPFKGLVKQAKQNITTKKNPKIKVHFNVMWTQSLPVLKF